MSELEKRLKGSNSDASETSESSHHWTDDVANVQKVRERKRNDVTKPPHVEPQIDGDVVHASDVVFPRQNSGELEILGDQLG